MKLSDELRQQLMESAAWGKAGILLGEGAMSSEDRVEFRKEQAARTRKVAKEGGLTPAGEKSMRKATGEGKYDPDRPSSKSVKDGTEYEDADGAEELQEAVHVCPLCVSELYEAIDEERILEHLNVVVGLVDRLSQLNEGDEDVETVIDETIQELLFQDLDEE